MHSCLGKKYFYCFKGCIQIKILIEMKKTDSILSGIIILIL